MRLAITVFLLICIVNSNNQVDGQQTKQRIALVTSCNFDSKTISFIKKRIKNLYGAEVDSIGQFQDTFASHPFFYFANGYNSDTATIKLLSLIPKGYTKIIGLTKTNIGLPLMFDSIELEYYEPLYGQTNINKNSCIISDFLLNKPTFQQMFDLDSSNSVTGATIYMIDSLNDSTYKTTYLNKLTNVILHETGHMFGLKHCKNDTCLMQGGGRIDDPDLCRLCKTLLKAYKSIKK